jgi:hypothetical protein
MKQPYHDIAVATGGSHYPDVGGRLLEQFGRSVVQRCMALADAETAERIAQEFGIEPSTSSNTKFN